MNKEQLLELLAALLSPIAAHPRMLPELMNILAKTGVEQKFLRLLTTRIFQEQQLGMDAIKLEEFERIGDGINSMHLSVSSQLNIRILYSYLSNGSLVLLHAFNKRGGKRKTDYTPALPVAKRRLEEMEGGLPNE